MNGTSTTDLKVWKNASSTWQQLDSIDFATTTDQVASGTISTNISSYIDASTTFSVLAGTMKGPLANGAACSSAGECNSNFCVDSVCCNSACNTQTCERCDSNSNAGAGTCGYVSTAVDPSSECDQQANDAAGCRGSNCSGTGYACGYQTSGYGGCVSTCHGCVGASSEACVHYTGWGEYTNCTTACWGCNAGACAKVPGDDTYPTNYCGAAWNSHCDVNGVCYPNEE